MIISNRIKRLTAAFRLLGVDAVLVNHETDIRYLTQYPAHDAWLLATPQETFYITDGRYIEEVRKGISGVTPVQFTRSLFETIIDLCRKAGVRSLGMDEQHLTVHQHKRLKSICCNKIRFIAVDGCVERLRMIKDVSELKLIRAALKLNLKAYQVIKP